MKVLKTITMKETEKSLKKWSVGLVETRKLFMLVAFATLLIQCIKQL